MANVAHMNADIGRELADRTHAKLTLEDRLDARTRARLDELLGRS